MKAGLLAHETGLHVFLGMLKYLLKKKIHFCNKCRVSADFIDWPFPLNGEDFSKKIRRLLVSCQFNNCVLAKSAIIPSNTSPTQSADVGYS